jgi:uncharacterized damage-inducible protein DinB
MATNPDQSIREHVVSLLNGGNAHTTFDDALAGLPANARGKKVRGLPYTAWMLLEHLRIAQWDILEFSRNPKHESPEWPKGYWPKEPAPSSDTAWNKSMRPFRTDVKAMEQLVSDPKTDLYATIPWGQGQTVLREALLVADHNAYHIGQMVLLRRLLGTWPAK